MAPFSGGAVTSVTSSGQVTAKSEGSAVITASAGGKTAAYSITVKAHEDPGQSPAETPEPGETPALADAPTPVIETVTETVIKEVVVTVEIDTTRLPEGSKYIKLPGGEIIELNGGETMSITVPEGSINSNGIIEFIDITKSNIDQVPLGSVEAEPVYKEDTSSTHETPLWKMLLILLGGLVVGATGALFVVRFVITKARK